LFAFKTSVNVILLAGWLDLMNLELPEESRGSKGRRLFQKWLPRSGQR
jgi:hypothetical protein